MNAPNSSPDTAGWSQWSIYVLKELERLSLNMQKLGDELNNFKLVLAETTNRLATDIKDAHEKRIIAVNDKIGEMEKEILALQLKSGMWGAIASLATTLVLLFGAYLTGHIK